MGDHKYNSRPYSDQNGKRPMIETATSQPNGIKQKTVRTSIVESETIIIAHQKDGWRISHNIPQGGGEILLIFDR